MVMFSIVIPAFNSAKWLESAVKSIQSQGLNDFEVIISDDSSKDDTLYVANQLSAIDNRLKVVSRGDEVNRGAAAARNYGLKFAEGIYVGFLDSDDRYALDTLSIVASHFKQNPEVGVVYGRTDWMDLSGKILHQENLGFATGKCYIPPELALDVMIRGAGDVPCTCAFFAKRSVIIGCGGFEEEFRLYEDQSLWLKLLLREIVFLSDDVLGEYIQHDRSTSALATATGLYTPGVPHQAEYKFLQWAFAECIRAGIPRDVLDAAFKDRFWVYAHPAKAFVTRKVRNAVNRARRIINTI